MKKLNIDYKKHLNEGLQAALIGCPIYNFAVKYGYEALMPAMCRLDYTMSETGGASAFVREYTLASGGPYCDCGYKRSRG